MHASLMGDSILSLGGYARVWTKTGERFPIWDNFG